jgi:hypothetical protein
MPHAALWPNLAWWTAQAPGYWRFRRALQEPERAQEHALSGILRANTGSAFGQAHRFAEIRAAVEFQRRVPLSVYEDYEPWLRRIRAGEQRVLTESRVTHLVPTSGSAAAAKLVPYTAALQREFAAAIAPWVFDLYRRDPDLMAGPAYWSVTPALPAPAVESVVPVGFEDDTVYLGGVWKRVVDATLAVPGSVCRLADVQEFRRVTLVALLRARALRLISVWHPSFLTLLLEHMATRWEELLAEIPDPARAAALRAGGPHDYRAIWPKLRLISCWADGPAVLAANGLRRAFPGVRVQAKGLLATEAFVSIPLGEAQPVAVRSHFFEFLDDRRRPRLVHELDGGAEYSVVVTTGGGLYRYRLQDRVRVAGFVRRTPTLEFIGKEESVADLFGEKLHEQFVAKVLEDTLMKVGLEARFAMLAPEPTGDGARYILLLETTRAIPGDLEARLEEGLQQNPNYRWCTMLGQLDAARVERVPANAFARYSIWRQQRGARLGGIKPCVLTADLSLAAILRSRDPPASLGAQ